MLSLAGMSIPELLDILGRPVRSSYLIYAHSFSSVVSWTEAEEKEVSRILWLFSGN